jgi:phage shock protein C
VHRKARKLYRSRDDTQLAGVCAGVADYADIDPTVVRLVSVGLLFVTGGIPGLLTYLAAWLIVPREPLRKPARNGQPVEQPAN